VADQVEVLGDAPNDLARGVWVEKPRVDDAHFGVSAASGGSHSVLAIKDADLAGDLVVEQNSGIQDVPAFYVVPKNVTNE